MNTDDNFSSEFCRILLHKFKAIALVNVMKLVYLPAMADTGQKTDQLFLTALRKIVLVGQPFYCFLALKRGVMRKGNLRFRLWAIAVSAIHAISFAFQVIA